MGVVPEGEIRNEERGRAGGIGETGEYCVHRQFS
jgi:hypothetical protein